MDIVCVNPGYNFINGVGPIHHKDHFSLVVEELLVCAVSGLWD